MVLPQVIHHSMQCIHRKTERLHSRVLRQHGHNVTPKTVSQTHMVLAPAPAAPGAHLRHRPAPGDQGRTAKSGQAPSSFPGSQTVPAPGTSPRKHAAAPGRAALQPGAGWSSAAAGLRAGRQLQPPPAPTGQRQRLRHGPRQWHQPPYPAVPSCAQRCGAGRGAPRRARRGGGGAVLLPPPRSGATAPTSSSSSFSPSFPLPSARPRAPPARGAGRRRALPAVAARPEVAPLGASPSPPLPPINPGAGGSAALGAAALRGGGGARPPPRGRDPQQEPELRWEPGAGGGRRSGRSGARSELGSVRGASPGIPRCCLEGTGCEGEPRYPPQDAALRFRWTVKFSLVSFEAGSRRALGGLRGCAEGCGTAGGSERGRAAAVPTQRFPALPVSSVLPGAVRASPVSARDAVSCSLKCLSKGKKVSALPLLSHTWVGAEWCTGCENSYSQYCTR